MCLWSIPTIRKNLLIYKNNNKHIIKKKEWAISARERTTNLQNGRLCARKILLQCDSPSTYKNHCTAIMLPSNTILQKRVKNPECFRDDVRWQKEWWLCYPARRRYGAADNASIHNLPELLYRTGVPVGGGDKYVYTTYVLYYTCCWLGWMWWWHEKMLPITGYENNHKCRIQ